MERCIPKDYSANSSLYERKNGSKITRISELYNTAPNLTLYVGTEDCRQRMKENVEKKNFAPGIGFERVTLRQNGIIQPLRPTTELSHATLGEKRRQLNIQTTFVYTHYTLLRVSFILNDITLITMVININYLFFPIETRKTTRY